MKNKNNKHKTTSTVEHLKNIKNQNGVDFSFNFLEIDDWLLLDVYSYVKVPFWDSINLILSIWIGLSQQFQSVIFNGHKDKEITCQISCTITFLRKKWQIGIFYFYQPFKWKDCPIILLFHFLLLIS